MHNIRSAIACWLLGHKWYWTRLDTRNCSRCNRTEKHRIRGRWEKI